MFGHSIAWPPEAAASLTTARGEKVLWPERLSSSTASEAPPPEDELLLELEEDELLDEELELLEDEELELLLDEELLLEDELEELLLEDEELELLLELDDELLLEEVPPGPAQDGAMKLPSWLPWKPKTLVAVWPGAGSCQLQQLVNWKLVPGLAPVRVATFHWLVIVTCSGKFNVTVQPLSAPPVLLVTLTSTWKKVPPVFEGVAVQLYSASA